MICGRGGGGPASLPWCASARWSSLERPPKWTCIRSPCCVSYCRRPPPARRICHGIAGPYSRASNPTQPGGTSCRVVRRRGGHLAGGGAELLRLSPGGAEGMVCAQASFLHVCEYRD